MAELKVQLVKTEIEFKNLVKSFLNAKLEDKPAIFDDIKQIVNELDALLLSVDVPTPITEHLFSE